SGLPFLPPSSPVLFPIVDDLLAPGRLEHPSAYLALVRSQALPFFDRCVDVVDLHVGVMRLLLHRPAFLCMKLNFESDFALMVKPSSVYPLVLVIAPSVLYYPKFEVAFPQLPG